LSSYDKSPYLYPLQGEKGILAGFQQLMNDNDYPNELNKTIDEIILEDGKVTGVKSGETVYQTNAVICSPDYAYAQAQQTGKHAKTICLYRHLLPKFENVPSSQLCLPSAQLDSQYDAQLLSLSNDNKVCAKDWYISIINSTSDSNSVPDLTLASDLLAPLEDKFSSITDTYEPIHDGLSSKLFLTKSHNNSNYDMENEILNLFEKVVGSRFNMESVSDSIKS
jgi:Rab GDP dissociation inhibitor